MFILLLAVTRPAPAFAQFSFDVWTTENGLPQNSVNDIVQTRDGYLWLATFGGLVRFDGVRFTVFDRSLEGIESQRVTALLEHSDGALWAGTEDGRLIEFRDGRFSTYGSEDGLPSGQAIRIEEDEEHNLWISWMEEATRDGIITRFGNGKAVTHRGGELPHGVAPPRKPLEVGAMDLWWSRDPSGLQCLWKGKVRRCLSDDRLPDGQ
ncbi:MAG: two-component regulator propeller domain-containing protein, partial [Vicinamibacterales bacterium]